MQPLDIARPGRYPARPAAYLRRATLASGLALLLALSCLTARAGNPVLTLQATVPTTSGIDVTAFVDQVEVLNAATGAVVASAVPNAGFETFTSLANGSYGYTPAGATWVFATQSGIATDGSPFGNPNAPEGSHVAFLQTISSGAGSFSQPLPSLASGYYQLRVRLAQRNSGPANQGVALLVDGREVGRTVPANDGAFHTYTSAVFPVDKVTLRLEVTASGSSNATFTDLVELLNGGSPVAGVVANAGFESFTSLDHGSYGYAPAGASWAFTSNSGIATNGSSARNPTAPEGTHVAFFQFPNQATEVAEQQLPPLAAGSYAVRLRAARLYNLTQSLRVLLGGIALGTLTPTSTSFQTYTTGSLNTAAAQPVISSYSPAHGAVVGTSVTLTGSNLDGAAYVSLDGLVVVPTGVSSTSLTFVVPAGVSAAPSVVVTSPFGPSAPGPAFTVQPRLLSVTGSSPAANARSAPLAGSALAVDFGEAITSASAANLAVFSAQAGGLKAGTVSVSNNRVSFAATAGTPVTDFRPGETVSVSVPSTIQSTTGLAVTPYVYQFTTATAAASGAFATATNYTTGGRPEGIALGDLNNDGYLDLVVAKNPNVAVFAGQANGTFGPETDYATGTGTATVGIALGDVNGDGRLDIVAANLGANYVSVLLGLVGGGFAAQMSSLSISSATYVTMGDVNGDGMLDLAVAGFSGLAVQLGQGGGTFGAPTVYLDTSDGRALVRGVALGDVNNDGRLDLVATNNNRSNISVWLALAGGGFAAKTDYTVGSGPYGVALGDMNDDGQLDIVTANSSGGLYSPSVSVLVGLAGGGFAPSANYSAGRSPNGVALGDVDGDGRLDIVTANTNTNNVSVLLGLAGGSFAASAEYPAGTAARAVALGDVNGDGRLDIAAANNDGGNNSVLLGLPPVCNVAVAVQNVSAPLGSAGTVTVPASAFDNGSTSPCGPVTASLRPVTGTGTVSGSVNGGGTLTLTAPAGAVFTSIDFASYGTPSSTAPYTQGSCHAPASQSTVESYLLGQSGSVSIPATPAAFGGDPCVGTTKTLAVTATYSLAGPAVASLAYDCSGVGNYPVLVTLTNLYGKDFVRPATLSVIAPPQSSLAWTGTTSADWADCHNWTYGQVPTASTDVTIPAGCAFYPSLPANLLVNVRNLTLAASSGLTIPGAPSTGGLRLYGSLASDLTTPLAGSVRFADQAGSPATATVRCPGGLTDVRINKALGNALVLAADLAVSSTLTCANGVLSTGSSTLTLGPAAALSETSASYITGLVQTTRDLNTAGTAYDFGGTGLTLTPSGSTLPGSTVVKRTTGTSLSGAGSSRSIQRYFDIQPAVNAGLSVDLALSYRDTELNGLSEANLAVFKSENGTAGPWARQPATLDAAANTARVAGVSRFSVWTLGDASAPLPVELARFTAEPLGADALLRWATAAELHNDHFDVEASADGRAFRRIGQVAGAGSSTQPHEYRFVDPAVARYAASPVYYRLRQVDLDGTFSYSPVCTVAVKGPVALALFPNPTTGVTTLTGAQPGTAVTVFDAVGRPVLAAPTDATGTAALLLPAGLPAGVYVVRVGGQAQRLMVE